MEQKDKKINIGIVIPNLAKGGAERVLIHFVNNIDKEKYQTVIFCLKKEGDLLAQVNEDVEVVDLDCPRVYFSVPRIKKAVKQYQVDVLIGWMGHINAVLAFFRSLLPRKLLLICRESSIPSKFIQHYRAPGLFRFMYRYMNRYDGIICQSKAMQQDLVDTFHVKPEKIKVINNPVVVTGEGAKINEDAEAFIRSGTKLLLFVGRFSSEKQVELLLQTMPLLDDSYRLLLIGYGPLEQQVRNKISEMNLGQNVLIVNDCSNPVPYYQEADCLVLTSAFEGFPNVLLEANLQGCPVVVYKTKGGAREIVEAGFGKYIAPETEGGLELLAAAIKEITEHPEPYNRQEMIAATKSRYDVNKTIRSYEEYITNLSEKKQLS